MISLDRVICAIREKVQPRAEELTNNKNIKTFLISFIQSCIHSNLWKTRLSESLISTQLFKTTTTTPQSATQLILIHPSVSQSLTIETMTEQPRRSSRKSTKKSLSMYNVGDIVEVCFPDEACSNASTREQIDAGTRPSVMWNP